MLRRVFINSKKVPVPVPIKTLDEALAWVEETLVPPGHSITRISLDDRLLTGREPDTTVHGDTRLEGESRLEVQIDSPIDLAVQTLDAVRNLASVIGAGLKQLAVDCWQARGNLKPTELDATVNDSQLLGDLIDHVSGIVDHEAVEMAGVLGIGALLKRTTVGLSMARANSDWKGAARILLNKLEPLLKDLVVEAETLHVRVATQPATWHMQPQNKKAPTG